MEKGTPVETRYGIFHVGDILKARLYDDTGDRGGSAIHEWVGELLYYADEAKFVIKDPEKVNSGNLRFAEPPILVKAWDADLRWFTSSCGRIEFRLSLEQAENVSHSGQCDTDVRMLSELSSIRAITDKLDPEKVRTVVSEMFADITEKELEDDDANIERLLWMAGNDIVEREGEDVPEGEKS
jgi:hypothetical protein